MTSTTTAVRYAALFFLACLMALSGNQARAVSFDCSKATHDSEKAICQSPVLRDLDDSLAAAYSRARVNAPDADALKSQQLDWVRSSRRCGPDTACLEAAYRTRIAQIGGGPTGSQPTARPPAANPTPPANAPAPALPPVTAGSPAVREATQMPASLSAPQPLTGASPAAGQGAPSIGMSDETVAAVHMADRGKACTTQPINPAARYAIDGYLLMPEFTQKFGSVSPHRLEKGLESTPERLLSSAKSEGCAVVVAESEDIGLLVAAMMSSRMRFQALPPKPAAETVQAVLKREGLERPEHLLLLDALPPRGNSGDVRELLAAGIGNPGQLAGLTKKIVDSGYSDRIDIDSLRGFLGDQKEGAGKGKSAVQVLKARQAAEAEAEKERQRAAEAERSAAEWAERWESFKSVATGVAVVIGVGLVAYLMAGASSACPSCGKWFAAQTLATYELGRRGAYETVERRDEIKNTKGELVGTVSRQEQVHVTYINLQDHKQCSKCSYQWVTEYTRKV